MRLDILLCLRTVQMWQNTVDINTLPYSGVSLQLQLIPEFRLPYKNKGHRAHGVKTVVEQKSEFFYGLFLKKVGLIQNADNLFILNATDDLNLILELTFRISTVEL